MRVLIFIFLFITQLSLAKAASPNDTISTSDTTSIVINQPDSITRKVIFLLIEASELSTEKPYEAIKHYRKALLLNKVKDPVWEANIRLALGRLLFRVKSKDAIPQLLKADALYKKKADWYGRSDAITAIARIQESTGLFTEALNNYNDLYRILNKAGEYVLAGNTATYLADLYLKKKNYPEALKYADLAKNSYYTVCRKDSLGSVYYKIAYIKRKQNSPKQAEFYILNEALSYYRSSNDVEGRLKSFDFLASLYLDQKRYSEAKWFYLQANNQARLANNTPGTIHSLIQLGVTKILIGDLVLAKQDISEAEELSQTDSIYAPIMKKAKIRYATLFKKLSAPVIASSVTTKSSSNKKQTAISSTKPKQVVKAFKTTEKKTAPPTVLVEMDKKEKDLSQSGDK
ncbi:MAG: tetratricopeptide repeat protein [Sphingobacteriaceae bacterium]|nr:tetratricopeptide repeat protein [Sphingobacteriaceae bacterium]